MSDTVPQSTDPMDALTPKERAFVEHYFAAGMNGSEAARRVSPRAKRPDQIAYEYLRKPEIKAAISARLDELAMPASEVLARLAAHARSDMGDFLRVDEEDVTLTWSLMTMPVGENGEVNTGSAVVKLAMQENVKPTDRVLHTATVRRSTARLDLLAAGEAGKLGLVKKYSIDKDGKVSIELYDAQAALLALAKHHKLLVERQEVTGANGGPIQIAPVDYRAGLDALKPDDADA